MRKLFIGLNTALLAMAAVVLVPAWVLADVPASYNSYGYATGVHYIAGSDAFPNFEHGAVNNRYPLAQVEQDASPSATALATYADSGPLVALWGFRDKTPHLPTADELARAASELIDMGVYPFVVPFRPLAGSLADRIGVRRGFVVGLAVFVLASAACAVANSVAFLIAARVAQGIGAAWLMSLKS